MSSLLFALIALQIILIFSKKQLLVSFFSPYVVSLFLVLSISGLTFIIFFIYFGFNLLFFWFAKMDT